MLVYDRSAVIQFSELHSTSSLTGSAMAFNILQPRPSQLQSKSFLLNSLFYQVPTTAATSPASRGGSVLSTPADLAVLSTGFDLYPLELDLHGTWNVETFPQKMWKFKKTVDDKVRTCQSRRSCLYNHVVKLRALLILCYCTQHRGRHPKLQPRSHNPSPQGGQCKESLHSCRREAGAHEHTRIEV